MPRLIPAAQRIGRARALIQQARHLPAPAGGGWDHFSYVAQVKDLLRQARDLVKFIPHSPSASAEVKDEVRQIFAEIEQAEIDILHKE